MNGWLKEFEPFFAVYDFRYIPDYNQFRKNTATGFLNVVFSISEYEYETVLELFLGVRHQKIEKIAGLYLDIRPDYKPHSTTLLASMNKFFNTDAYRFIFKNTREEKDRVMNIVLNLFRQKCEPELVRINDLEYMNQLFNGQPHTPNPLLVNVFNRAIRGLAIAYYKDFEKLDYLYDCFSQAIQHQPDIYKDKLTRLYHKLLSSGKSQ